MAITVEIDGIVAIARGNKLWQAHGAGVGSAQLARLESLLSYQQQELFQFPAEKLGAARIVESQRNQAIEYRILTLVDAVKSLNPDNGDDNFCGHTKFTLRPLQAGGVGLVELYTLAGARVGNKNVAVLMPGLGFFRGAGNRFQN